MEIIYRTATPEDAAALLEYMKRIGGESDNLLFGPEGMPLDEEQERRFLTTCQDDPNTQMLLVIDTGEIVGISTVQKYARPRTAHRMDFSVAVRKSHWGRGIGSNLMERQIAFAKAAGVEIIQLSVRSDNTRAIRLYQKWGFVPFGTYPRFFKINGEYFDAVYMTKFL